MSYQPGTASSAAMAAAPAMGPAGVYVVAAAAAVDIVMSLKAEEESAKQAQALRDSKVQQQTYANRAANADLLSQQETATRSNFEMQLRELETRAQAENADRGVQSSGLSRVADKYTRRFTDAVRNTESSMRALEVQNRMRAKAGELELTDRINAIPIQKADTAGTLVNAGLTIYGMKQQQARQAEERKQKLGDGAGTQTVET